MRITYKDVILGTDNGKVWKTPHLEFYSVLFQHQIEYTKSNGAAFKYTPDDAINLFEFEGQQFAVYEGSEHVVADLYEPYAIDLLSKYALEISKAGLQVFVEQSNCPFKPAYVELPEHTTKVDFHYTNACNSVEFLQSLNRKQRWKYKNELQREGAMSVEFYQRKDFPYEAVKLYYTISHSKYTRKYANLNKAFLEAAAYANGEYFVVRAGHAIIGIGATVLCGNVRYVACFHSREPCVYSTHLHLIDRYPNTDIHYGSAISFADDEADHVYMYKRNLANRKCVTNYLAIVNDHTGMFPPVYSGKEQRWIEE